jgi:hypothetical protein
MSESTPSRPAEGNASGEKSEAALRALREAAERRKERDIAAASTPAEVGGREGPDPVRYGDWEKGGIASDF